MIRADESTQAQLCHSYGLSEPSHGALLAREGADLKQRYSAFSAPDTLNDAERSVEAIIASETPVLRYDVSLDGIVDEILPMDTCRLDNCRSGIPLVDSHQYDTIDSLLGSTTDLRIDADFGVLLGVRHFADTDQASKVFALIKQGHLRGQSVGYRVYGFAYASPGAEVEVNGKLWRAGDRHLRVATAWEPIEDSVVILPADRTTGCRHGMDMTSEPNEEGTTMPETNVNVTDALQAERARVKEINELAARFELGQTFVNDAVENGTSVDEARAIALDALHARQSATPVVTITATPYEKKREALTDAILVRGGVMSEKDADKGIHEVFRTGRGMMVDVARDILSDRGVTVSKSETDEGIIQRAIATGDLPDLLQSAVKKSAKLGWELNDENYQLWTGSAIASDLREQTLVSALANVEYREVPEGGSYDYLPVVGDKVSYKVAKYGRRVAITWEALINDDLSQLTVIPEAIARGYRQLEGDLAYSFLISNPQFADGKALFHADHGNLGTAAAPSESAVNTALNAIALQTDKAGNNIRLTPECIIAPLKLRQTIVKLLDSERFTDGEAGATQVNSIRGAFNRRIFEPRLDQAFTAKSPWFLVAQPRYGVKLVHLSGFETPTITTRQSFEIDGMETKVRHVVGAYCENYQALYMNPGV